MAVNRRKFLKIAGVSVLAFGAKPATDALAITPMEWLDKQLEGFSVPEFLMHFAQKPAGSVPAESLKATRWAMAVNVRMLDEEIAEACAEVCHRIHNVPHIKNPKREIKWLWHDEYEHVLPGQQHEHIDENLKKLPFLVLCNHCYNPPCCRVCPTKATWKRKSDGVVMMDQHRCIGCRFCMAACPFGARSFNWVDPRNYIKEEEQNREYPTRTIGVVEKCQFCAERLAKGQIPACVEVAQEMCRKKGKEPALVFGDLDDPDSEVRQVLRSHYSIRRKPELGTHPNVYYVV
jgi:molybdopterin-containing oxidoreductase family iron-sulfur binding subunit